MKRMFSAITSNLTVKFFKLFSKRKGVNNPTLQETAEVRKEGLGINAKEFTNFCKPQKKIKLHELRPNLCPPYQDLKRPTHLVLEGGERFQHSCWGSVYPMLQERNTPLFQAGLNFYSHCIYPFQISSDSKFLSIVRSEIEEAASVPTYDERNLLKTPRKDITALNL